MAEREEKRGQFTLKGYEITPEFITRVRLAAKARKRTMVAYIVETMTEQAEADLKGSRGEHMASAHPVPARQEDVANVANVLTALVQRLDERDSRINDRLDKLETGGTPAPKALAEVTRQQERIARQMRVLRRRGR